MLEETLGQLEYAVKRQLLTRVDGIPVFNGGARLVNKVYALSMVGLFRFIDSMPSPYTQCNHSTIKKTSS